MRLILREDVQGLGKRGDVCDVADGYGRNYLVPRGLAMRSSEGAATQASAMRKSRDVRDARDREAATAVATTLVPTVIHITARASDEGRLFGSIGAQEVADAVLAQTTIELDRRSISVDEPIKETGTHTVAVKLHAEVEFPVTLEVAGSAE